MAENVQVLCINKTNRLNPHERISHIGGVHGGKQWKLSEADAIQGIKKGQWAFFTQVGGKTAWVIVATHLGREYLKTQSDGITPDNLLALPDCP